MAFRLKLIAVFVTAAILKPLTYTNTVLANDGCTLIRKPSKPSRIFLRELSVGDLQCAKFDVPPFSIGVLHYKPVEGNTAEKRLIAASRSVLDQDLLTKVHRFRYQGQEAIIVGPSDFSVPRRFKVLDEISKSGDVHTRLTLHFINIEQSLIDTAKANSNQDEYEDLIFEFNQQMSDFQKQIFFEAMWDAIAESLETEHNTEAQFSNSLSNHWDRKTLTLTPCTEKLLLDWAFRNRDLVKRRLGGV
ncbi:MAG: hypothetical protein QNJ29_07450 [Rhizobiaceae bacterium]|nr:hypothetical protein [Rhizobiaceae bacterium]